MTRQGSPAVAAVTVLSTLGGTISKTFSKVNAEMSRSAPSATAT